MPRGVPRAGHRNTPPRKPPTRALSVRVSLEAHAYWLGQGERLREWLEAKARKPIP